MKRLVVKLMIGVFALSVAGTVYAFPCMRCHKTEKDLKGKISSTKARSGDELADYLKNKSPKKGIHKNFTNEDIKKVYDALFKKQGMKK
ncbi:MAG: hypothetical protein ACPLSJ_03850 [Thermosulfidibacteraceae bacterium]